MWLGRRDPTIAVDRRCPEHFEILGMMCGGRACVGLIEGVSETDAFDRFLLDAVDHIGLRDADCFQDRWHNVDYMVELCADTAGIADVAGPLHDHAVSSAAKIRGDLFGPLEGRIQSPRPPDRIVSIGILATP